MKFETFLALYVVLIIVAIFLEIYILANDKYKYIRESFRHLTRMFDRNVEIDNVDLMVRELKRLYTQYRREYPRFCKFYPNIIVWLDTLVFRLDTYNKVPQILLERESVIKNAREVLENEMPFYQCNEYQQDILNDMKKLEFVGNEMIIENLLDRIRTEFLRQNTDNARNRVLNTVSVIIGLTGIGVSVILALIP